MGMHLPVLERLGESGHLKVRVGAKVRVGVGVRRVLNVFVQ